MLCKDLNRKIRSLICKVRCRTLPIHLGRYRNIPGNQWLCRYCDRNEVEDAVHLLFKLLNVLYQLVIQWWTCHFALNELHSDYPLAMLHDVLNDNDLSVKTGYYPSKLLINKQAVWTVWICVWVSQYGLRCIELNVINDIDVNTMTP